MRMFDAHLRRPAAHRQVVAHQASALTWRRTYHGRGDHHGADDVGMRLSLLDLTQV